MRKEITSAGKVGLTDIENIETKQCIADREN